MTIAPTCAKYILDGTQPKLTALALALRAERGKIIANWLGTLRIGIEKPGHWLTDTELKNHFGSLLEDLCNQLEMLLTEASEFSALKHAESHDPVYSRRNRRLLKA